MSLHPRRPRSGPLVEALERRRLLSADIAASAPVLSGDLPARQMEQLDRGLVAINTGGGNAYIGWRMLGTDPANVAFNVYRSTGGGQPVKRNAVPLTATTDFTDTGVSVTSSNSYFIRAIVNGVEQPASEIFTLAANGPVQPFLSISLQIPAGGTTPDGVSYTYSANDVSVGDLDGDGAYEYIVKWDPTNAKDNSQSGYTGNVYLDAYKLNGTRLWRIDLGINIRAGAHYTQFMVYDLDGDGRAELACKTAPGTKDGLGNDVILSGHDPAADYRNSGGYILSGPEYLTVFNGLTGAAMATKSFVVARGTVSSWGDSYGNRVDRFLAGVAYLDGQRPSLIMGRGYYERTTVSAWNWRNGQLTQAWATPFDTEDATPDPAYENMGAHSLSIADVDADGRDEIIYGAMTLDDDGTGLYSSGFGHGDALHVSDMDPVRPGLEVFQVHESSALHQGNGGTLRDAATGALIAGVPGSGDVGRGVAMDLDPRLPGYEMWTTGSPDIYNVNGAVLQPKPPNMFINFGVWWDADPLRELLDGTTISDWRQLGGTYGRFNYDLDPLTGGTQSAPNVSSNNGTKSTPALSADLLGDWREEVIWRRSDNTALHIYTTTIPSTMRLFTLMHDPQYRTAIAWQNTAYNQPPHPSFFVGNGMAMPAMPNIYTVASAATPGVYQSEDHAFGGGSVIESTNAGYNGIGYINFPTDGGFLQFNNVDGGAGGATTIHLRFALGAATARTGTLVVNGVSQPITFNPTGSFTTWLEQSISVTLNPGTANTIRLNSTGQDLANIDQLRVDPPAPGATVGGFIFHDTNANNLRDADEPPLAGVTVFLDVDDDGEMDASELRVVSSAAGEYEFSGVEPGAYTVRTIAPLNFVATSSAPVTLSTGSAASANVAHARVVYEGTAGADQYLVRRSLAGRYEILIGGVLAYTVFADAPLLAFNLGDSSDTLVVDAVNGVPAPAGGLSFSGGAGEETLILRGSGGADAVIFGNGLITVGGKSIILSGIERMTFDGKGGADQLSISSGTVELAATQSLAGLTIQPPGVLDVRDHELVVDYSSVSPVGVWTGNAYDGLTGYVAAGRVMSSLAVPARKGIGIAEARDVLGISGAQTGAWGGAGGRIVDSTSVLLKFTWLGDATLDGRVNVDDYGRIDSGIASGARGWYSGDFNFDGVINVDDYGLIDSNVAGQDEIL